jgi:hypothetical protein
MKSNKKGLFITRDWLEVLKIRLKNESAIPVIALGDY